MPETDPGYFRLPVLEKHRIDGDMPDKWRIEAQNAISDFFLGLPGLTVYMSDLGSLEIRFKQLNGHVILYVDRAHLDIIGITGCVIAICLPVWICRVAAANELNDALNNAISTSDEDGRLHPDLDEMLEASAKANGVDPFDA